jgi:polysaccharide biosynthesis/export protein
MTRNRAVAMFLCCVFVVSGQAAPLVFAETSAGSGQAPAAVSYEHESFRGAFAYIIGCGDVLDVKVWRHPDLAQEAVVRPDGNISFPLVGDVKAADLAPDELKKEIARRLMSVVRDPQVTVNVKQFMSQKIFVLGEVNRPGVYPFEGRVSILDAIGRAGSYKDTATIASTVVIRTTSVKKPEALRVNLAEVFKNARVEQNILLEPGDIVFVPKSFIAKLDQFIDQFFAKTEPALLYYLDIVNIKNQTGRGW